MHILLLSAYDAPSHRYWREGLERYCQSVQAGLRFTQLALPPRHFSWRVRGNSLSWAFSERAVLEKGYDLVLATSLVDMSALRGLVPSLASTTCIVYCHENQFAYPSTGKRPAALEPQMVNLYSALCADTLVFNSAWNRDSFLEGAQRLLQRFPDRVPVGLVARLADRAEVLPVPIEDVDTMGGKPGDRLEVVWNHRWEHDKGPAALLAAIESCAERKLSVRFHLLGQQFRQQPEDFTRIAELFKRYPAMAGNWGRLEQRADYYSCLASADIVLSTAVHEFQGLAVMEAMARDCLPLVPDRLSYQEFVPREFRYVSTPEQPELEGEAIAAALARRLENVGRGQWPAAPTMRDYYWTALGPRYLALLRGQG